jgi:hypothetical protein
MEYNCNIESEGFEQTECNETIYKYVGRNIKKKFDVGDYYGTILENQLDGNYVILMLYLWSTEN